MVEDVSFAVDYYELNVETVCGPIGCDLKENPDVGSLDVIGTCDDLVSTDGEDRAEVGGIDLEGLVVIDLLLE